MSDSKRDADFRYPIIERPELLAITDELERELNRIRVRLAGDTKTTTLVFCQGLLAGLCYKMYQKLAIKE